jgi:hypothetical protein
MPLKFLHVYWESNVEKLTLIAIITPSIVLHVDKKIAASKQYNIMCKLWFNSMYVHL